jgi:hypothetical protein
MSSMPYLLEGMSYSEYGATSNEISRFQFPNYICQATLSHIRNMHNYTPVKNCITHIQATVAWH